MGIFRKIKKLVTKPITDANGLVNKVTGVSLPDPNNPMAALGGLLGKRQTPNDPSHMETLMMDPMAQGGVHTDFNSQYAGTLSALANSAQMPTNYGYSSSWSPQPTAMNQMQGLMNPGQMRSGYGYYSRNRMGAF